MTLVKLNYCFKSIYISCLTIFSIAFIKCMHSRLLQTMSLSFNPFIWRF